MKKFLLILIFSVILINSPTAYGAYFKDISSSHPNHKDITELFNQGIIKGYSDNTFRPNSHVTKSQVAIMMVRALQAQNKTAKDPGFKDVAKKHSAFKEISIATDLGLFPKQSYFKPDEAITRGEMARVLTKAFNLTNSNVSNPFKDVAKSYEYYDYITILYSSGVTKGYENNTFKPNNPLTRAQFSTFLNRAMQISNNQFESENKNSLEKQNPTKKLDVEILSIKQDKEDSIFINFSKPTDVYYEIYIDGKKVQHVTFGELKMTAKHQVFLNERFYGEKEIRINLIQSDNIVSTYTQTLEFNKDNEKPTLKEISFSENHHGTVYIRFTFNEDIILSDKAGSFELKYVLTNSNGERIRGNRVIDTSDLVNIGSSISQSLMVASKNEWPLEFSITAKNDVLVIDKYGNNGPKEIYVKFSGTSLNDIKYEFQEIY
ncbi:S-layer homology domain-containing protein [Bacillus ndiopicus]|uniref:S-layer homology domain-containing protein n=1 Tax=Bacillus ndiopicus TaxID=1347368 RepID=UPI000694892C|nr:S-layer homology domain-containing protein [Bacillus ndiopicus]